MLNIRRKEVKYLLNLSIIGLELVISRMHVPVCLAEESPDFPKYLLTY